MEKVSDFRPMDADALALHAAEPCHLAFCELVDGGGELGAHLVEGELSGQVEGDELVLKSIVDQVFRRDAFEQAADLFGHTFLKTGVKPPVYAGVAFLAGDQCADVICVLREEGGACYGVLRFVKCYLQGSYETLARVVVGGVMEGF